jgi:hypothetical protein
LAADPRPLHEDVLLPAVIDDVPDDQEVAGEIELLDEIELAANLRAGLVVIRTVSSRAPTSVMWRRNDASVSPGGTG